MESASMRVKKALKPIILYWVRSGHRGQLTRHLGPAVANLRGVILDIGGGRDAAHDRFYHVDTIRVRVDLAARHRPDVVANAASLPFRAGSVDGIVMSEILEHVPHPDRVLSEARRVLRAGGTICGSVPFIMVVHADPHDYYRYTSDGLQRLLAGFSRVTIVPHGNHFGAAWRLISIRLPVLKIANPVVRLLSLRTDGRCPEGYTFSATK